MKKAIILYQSKTGTTKSYANEIGRFLNKKQIETQCVPIGEYHPGMLKNTDYLLMGCWTKGLMVIAQKPDELWSEFAQQISVPSETKVALFATFKILTGSMFKNMAKHIKQEGRPALTSIKSRDGKLSDYDKLVLEEFLVN